MNMEIDDLKLKIRDIPDFPSKGIIFLRSDHTA